MWPVASGAFAPAKSRQSMTGIGTRCRNEEVWVRQSGTELGHACGDVVGDETLDVDALTPVLIVEGTREEVNICLIRG